MTLISSINQCFPQGSHLRKPFILLLVFTSQSIFFLELYVALLEKIILLLQSLPIFFFTKNGFTSLTPHLPDLTSSGSWPVLKKTNLFSKNKDSQTLR